MSNQDYTSSHPQEYVYVVSDDTTGTIKIGYSNNPLKRFKSIQTGSSCDYRLAGYRAAANARMAERIVHGELAKYRVRNEWFCVSEAVALETIDEVIRNHNDSWEREWQQRRRFHEWFREAFEALSKDRELWGTPRAVLDYLLSRLDFDNFILVQQSEVAAALGIGRDQVSRSTAKLVEKGVLFKGPKAGRTCTYKLNSSYGWKGRVANLNQERRARLSVAVDNTKP